MNKSAVAEGLFEVTLAEWHYEYVKEPLILAGFILVIAGLKIGYHVHKKIPELVPESCCLILVGVIIGKLMSLDPGNESHTFLLFHSRTFFLFVLPPIIVEASYSLQDPAFSGNVATIFLYAVVGTILNIAIVGAGLSMLGQLNLFEGTKIRPVDSFVFSSLIASVDPVAVLAIFQQVGVNKVLYFLVLGESIFNDAVTIVFYNTMVAFTRMAFISEYSMLISFGSFFTDSFGGIGIGLVCGMVTALFTRLTKHVHAVEPLIVFGMAYMSYLLAELFHFSGIISIIVCGMNQNHYAMKNISKDSRTTIVYFAKAASSGMEALIFIILGVMMVAHADFWNAWEFCYSYAICALILVLISRFFVVFVLTFAANMFLQGLRTISVNEQLIMAYGGLRGAVCFSLAVMLNKDFIPGRDSIITTTYIIILFTVFIQGTTMKPLVHLLHIGLRSKKIQMIAVCNKSVIHHVMWGVEEIVSYHDRKWIITHKILDGLDWLLICPRMRHENSKSISGHKILGSFAHLKEEEEEASDYEDALEDKEPEFKAPQAVKWTVDAETGAEGEALDSTSIQDAFSHPHYRTMLGSTRRDLTHSVTDTHREQTRRLRQVFGGKMRSWTPQIFMPQRTRPRRRFESDGAEAVIPRAALTVPAYSAADGKRWDPGTLPTVESEDEMGGRQSADAASRSSQQQEEDALFFGGGRRQRRVSFESGDVDEIMETPPSQPRTSPTQEENKDI